MQKMIESLTKLAEDLTARVDSLEKENQKLRSLAKEASAAKTETVEVPKAGESVIQNTCDRLVEVGAITEAQVPQAKMAYMNDPEAAFRTIQAILDAQIQAKSASALEDVDLSGGRLIHGAQDTGNSAYADSMERMERILGLK